MSDLVERVARAIYDNANGQLGNCWSWDDSGLDDEHPGAREKYMRAAHAAVTEIESAHDITPKLTGTAYERAQVAQARLES